VTSPTFSRASLPEGGPSLPEELRSSSSPLHVLARVVLVLTLCGAPWAFGAVQAWAWASLLVLALLALVLWAAGCAQRGVLRIVWTPFYWLFLAFLVFGALQWFAGWTVDPIATREAVLKILTNLVLFFLAGQLLGARADKGSALEWLGLMAMLLAAALCILGLAQFFGSRPGFIYWTFPARGAHFGPYVNHNDYAGLMEMLLPIAAAYLFSRSWNSVVLLWFWALIGMVIISIWISGSRGATIVLLVEGLLWAGLLMGNRGRGVSPRLFAISFAVVLLAAVGFSWLVSTGHVGDRAWSGLANSRSLEVNLGDRFKVGVDTLRMARSHPWTGVGVGCFESAFPNYMSVPMNLHWGHAHDDFLEALAEMGLPGAAMMATALGLFFFTAFRQVERRFRHGWGWLQIGAAVGVVGLLVHSLVDFNLRIPANAAWFVACLAIATHPGPPPRNRRRIGPDSPASRKGEFLTQ
jgi:O-antigen ligase